MLWLITTRIRGGSAETLQIAVAVMPFETAPARLVITVTVDAMHRMAALNCAASTESSAWDETSLGIPIVLLAAHAEVIAQGVAFILTAEESVLLQDRHHLTDEILERFGQECR